VTFFNAGDARLQGVESHIDVPIGGMVSLEGGLDYVRGELTSLGQPLPRIPPLRGRLGLRIQRNAFQVGADGVFHADQNRIFVDGETETPGFNLLKVFASYSFGRGPVANTITVRLDNVTDELYYNHLNYLKDLIPEMGRNLKVLYNVRF
jgi:iron complex outermembrane receptor protein